MAVVFTTKALNYAIKYWIEITNMTNELNNLEELSDEVGENYEYDEWFRDNQDGSGLSVMDLHVKIEEAARKAFEVEMKAEERLQELILAGIEIGDRKLTEYPVGKVDWNEKIEELMIILHEQFGEIYSHDTRDYLNNFYRELNNAIRLICEEES